MKTLNILALILTLLVTPVIAAAQETDHSGYDLISEKIRSTIQLPDEYKNEPAGSRVLVVFSITENGDVMVHEVGTGNPGLKASLTAQFEGIQFDNSQNQYDGMYSIWLNFKTL
ncbi:MAG TPA: hypothetical protein VK826_05285 [Bacteroidia bacterium]|nr:hypothetical protein [Bacteroidia bacterium]